VEPVAERLYGAARYELSRVHSDDRRKALSAIRTAIRKNLPKGYEEGIQYGMIGYYVPHSVYPAGYHTDPKQPVPFASIASQKNHMAIYLFCIYTSPQAKEDFIDPVGACIGVKGSRILPISRELSGEKIEIIRWTDDVAELVARALSPAKVLHSEAYEDENGELRVEVVVPDDQLSLAIGKHGVNARLASKLVGQIVGIDIIKESDYRKLEELEAMEDEE